ncbi:hypothetical protein [Desulfurococcus amylolyticus]|uniref:hypothetical protein n=1 Tax=Desulfurococcus amylolyticus TaxID=94694 RepID=UPI000A4014E8|nr:hypothetical protein [Desulfurococcus amylolyticus]
MLSLLYPFKFISARFFKSIGDPLALRDPWLSTGREPGRNRDKPPNEDLERGRETVEGGVMLGGDV